MKTYDVRGQNIKEIFIDDTKEDVEVLQLSNNKIESFPHDFFLKRKIVFQIDCSRNMLRNISPLQHIQCLSVLDLRFNSLKLSDLYYLRFCTIGDLKLYGNSFQNDPNYRPLMIPAIIKNAWIIDGVFVTDHIRKMAKELRESKTFYLEVRPRRLLTNGDEMTVAEKKIFDFCSDIDYNSPPDKVFLSPRGVGLVSFVEKPQTERLRFLGQSFEFNLKPGTFIDYFSITLGILCEQWFGESVSTIPRYMSRAYWYNVQSEISGIQNWMQLIVLQKIRDVIEPRNDCEKDLWESLMLNRFLATGKPPLPGSTSRLLLTAFFARAIAQSDVTVSDYDDLRIYFKYRRTCGFTSKEDGLEAIHDEILSPFIVQTDSVPNVGDKISIAHPLTGEWSEGEAIAIRNGRIFIRVEDIIVQMPVGALFWDGRGIWKENAKNGSLQSIDASKKKKSNIYTFLTQSEADEEVAVKPKDELVEARTAFEPPPLISLNIAPENSTTFLQKGRESLKRSKFIDRSVKKSVTFRGIVDPPFASTRPKSARRPPAKTSVHQVVDNVVNVVQGKEVSDGKFLKKYQVKMVNQLTKKAKYVWINEEDVSPYDVAKLDEMYQSNFNDKMKVQFV